MNSTPTVPSRDLMGKRTEARYEFLMANAALADNLDV